MPSTFTKLLVGQYSPQNGCNVPDGEVLTVIPKANVPLHEHLGHEFRAAANRQISSKYGWVREVAPFSLQEFVATYLDGRDLTPSEQQHLETMFQSIAKLPAGTPVAATYSSRGVEAKRMDFTVHRVILYKG